MIDKWEDRWEWLRLGNPSSILFNWIQSCCGNLVDWMYVMWHQFWRCISFHGMRVWLRHGCWARSHTCPVERWVRVWMRWRSSSRGTRLSRSQLPLGKSVLPLWRDLLRWERALTFSHYDGSEMGVFQVYIKSVCVVLDGITGSKKTARGRGKEETGPSCRSSTYWGSIATAEVILIWLALTWYRVCINNECHRGVGHTFLKWVFFPPIFNLFDFCTQIYMKTSMNTKHLNTCAY